MKKVVNSIAILSLSLALFSVACRKNEPVEVDNETQSAVDNAVADQEYAAIVPTTNNHAILTKGTGSQGRSSSLAPCEVLNWLNATNSYTAPNGKVFPQADTNVVNGKYVKVPIYELDLSSPTCSLSFVDGKQRTGKWLVYFTAPARNVNAMMVVKLLNHKTRNTITYECDSLVVTTEAKSAPNTNPAFFKYNVKLVNGFCKTSNWTIAYSFNRTFTHYPNGKVNGESPVTEVFGTANGITRQGKKFSVVTSPNTACIKHRNCEYIDKGIVELTPEGFKTRTVDFGNGTCDDKAKFTVNGNTVDFQLK